MSTLALLRVKLHRIQTAQVTREGWNPQTQPRTLSGKYAPGDPAAKAAELLAKANKAARGVSEETKKAIFDDAAKRANKIFDRDAKHQWSSSARFSTKTPMQKALTALFYQRYRKSLTPPPLTKAKEGETGRAALRRLQQDRLALELWLRHDVGRDQRTPQEHKDLALHRLEQINHAITEAQGRARAEAQAAPAAKAPTATLTKSGIVRVAGWTEPANLAKLHAVQDIVSGKLHIPTEAEFKAKGYEGDVFLGRILAQLGTDGKPDILSPEQMNAAVSKGAREMFRGIQDPAHAEALASGAWHPGMGMYANGMHVYMSLANPERFAASHFYDAAKYAKDNGVVVRMALKRDAKIASLGQVEAAQRKTQANVQEHYAAKLAAATTPSARARLMKERDAILGIIRDPGRMAALMGADALGVHEELTPALIRHPDYHNEAHVIVVVNRTAFFVQKPFYHPGDAEKHAHDRTLTLPTKASKSKGRKAKRVSLPALRLRLSALTERAANPNQARESNGRFAPGSLAESEAKHPSLSGAKIGGEGYRAHREASRLKDALAGLKAKMDELHAHGDHAAADHVRANATWRGVKGYAAITRHYAEMQTSAEKGADRLAGDAKTRAALHALWQEYATRAQQAGHSEQDRARLREERNLLLSYGRRAGVDITRRSPAGDHAPLTKAERDSIRQQVADALGQKRMTLPELRLRLAEVQRHEVHGADGKIVTNVPDGGVVSHAAPSRPDPLAAIYDVRVNDHPPPDWMQRAAAAHGDQPITHICTRCTRLIDGPMAGERLGFDPVKPAGYAGHPKWSHGLCSACYAELDRQYLRYALYQKGYRPEAIDQHLRDYAASGLPSFGDYLRARGIWPQDSAPEYLGRAQQPDTTRWGDNWERQPRNQGKFGATDHSLWASHDVQGQRLPFSQRAFDQARQQVTPNDVRSQNRTGVIHINGVPYILKDYTDVLTGPEAFLEARNEAATVAAAKALGLGHLVPDAAYHVQGSDGHHYAVVSLLPGTSPPESADWIGTMNAIAERVPGATLGNHVLLDYVLGVQDRHDGNFLFDPATARLTQIDFGRSFTARPDMTPGSAALAYWMHQTLRDGKNFATVRDRMVYHPAQVERILKHQAAAARVARQFKLHPDELAALRDRFHRLRAWYNGGDLSQAALERAANARQEAAA